MFNMMGWYKYIHCEMITPIKLMSTSITSELPRELIWNVKMFSTVLSAPLPPCSAFTSTLLNWVFSMKEHSEPAELCSGPVIHSFFSGEGQWRCLIHGLVGAWVSGFLNPPPAPQITQEIGLCGLIAPTISDTVFKTPGLGEVKVNESHRCSGLSAIMDQTIRQALDILL